MTEAVLDERAWKARLDDGGKQLGIDLDQSQLELLWRYAQLLRERNQHVNLTSIVSLEGILTLHMLDSLSVAIALGDSRRLMDVGTGGGFPGIPLAVAFPQKDFTLIDGTQKKMPGELSGGQRKRVALARAIALNPRVILYDEPTTGLDPIRSDVINELILKLKRELNVTSIVMTHDMNSAFKVADRIVMLHEGHLIFDGTPEELKASDDQRVKRFVLGEADEQELAGLNTVKSAPAPAVPVR